MRYLLALLVAPLFADAGVVYDVSIRPVDQSDMDVDSRAAPSAIPVVTRYSVEDGKVRVGGANAKTVYLFKDKTMYVIDNPERSVHLLRHATLSQLAAHYEDALKQLQNAASSAPPDDRAEAQRKAADMKEVSDRMRQTVPRDFKVTVRFESVDGHACRIWEESEKDEKRLELCIAPPATVAGGADILSGLKTLSQFRQGSDFAFGIDFGLSDWWPDFSLLGGVPLLIREYKYDSEILEVMLSGMTSGAQGASPFNVPEGYRIEEGPDYTQWYVR